MSRSIAAALYALCLTAGVAGAGNAPPMEQQSDASFAPVASPPNWRRIYSSGTVDEKGVDVARTPDGGFVSLISVPGGSVGSKIGLVRYGPDGALYSGTFGSSGKVILDGLLVALRAMVVDSLGRIVVVGTAPGPGGATDFGVLRFNANGSVDTSFGTGGRVAIGMEPVVETSDDQPVAVVELLLSSGQKRLVIAGNSLMTEGAATNPRVSLIGLRDDGSVDPDFGNYTNPLFDGRSTHEFAAGAASYTAGLLKLPGNALLLVGTRVWSASDTDFGACTFFGNGLTSNDFCATFAVDEPGAGGSLYDNATAVVQTGADAFVVVGNASGRMAARKFRLVEYVPQSDTTFVGSSIPGRPNIFVSELAGSSVSDVAVRSDGRLLLAGSANIGGLNYGAMMRLRRDGSPDTSPLYSANGLAYFIAPTLSNAGSYSTEFTRVLIDEGKPLLYGSSPDNTMALTDFDGIMTRLKSDLIFANGLQ
jgi:uncharacterized delta-60 repeat protein